MGSQSNRAVALGAASLLGLWAVPASAQTGKDDRAGDVVVTALKQPTDLAGAPATVQVVTGAELEARNVTELGRIGEFVPLLRIDTFNGRAGAAAISVRGIATGEVSVENRLAIYVDGVPLLDPSSLFLKIYDMQQIEVLKGAQGALYGANAQGGVIDVTTRAPGRDLIGRVRFQASERSQFDALAGVSGPLTNTLSIGLDVLGSTGDGPIHYTSATGSIQQRDGAARARLRWQPDQLTTVDAVASWQKVNDRGAGEFYPLDRTRYNAALAPLGVQARDYELASDYPTRNRTRTWAGSLTVDRRLGAARLFAVGALRDTRYDYSIDFDGSPLPIATGATPGRTQERYGELRLSSATGATPFSWAIGGSVVDWTRDQRLVLGVLPLGSTVLGLPVGSFDFTGKARLDGTTVAGFAFGEVRPGDGAVGLNAAVRVEHARRRLDRGASVFGTPGFQGSYGETFALPRVGADWRVAPGQLLYLQAGRGWAPGGYSPFAASNALAAFRKEVSTNIEFGWRGRADPAHLSWNVAAFRARYRDLQTEEAAGVLAAFLSNARSARSQGVEATLDWKPVPTLTATVAAGYADARYRSFVRDTVANVRFDGLRLPNAPVTTLRAGTEWRPRAGLSFGADLVRLGRFVAYDYQAASANTATYRFGDDTVVNLRAGYEAAHWSAGVVVDNVGDVLYPTAAVRVVATGVGYAGPGGTLAPRRSIGGYAALRF